MTATAQIRVWDGPKELNLAPAKTEVTKGSGTQIGVTDEQGNDVEAESLTWASSDETVAQVSGGWVDVTGTGAVKITASTEYGVSSSVELTGVAPAARPGSKRWGHLWCCQFRQLWSRWQFCSRSRCRTWLLDRVR